VITAGWRSGRLESLYPRGIPIGTVASVGQQDVDLYKRIQVSPLVNFDSLSEVIVLVERPKPKPKAKTKK
jgi:rod shape-determining protein MreC